MDKSVLVPCALVFVDELDAQYPNRPRGSDGSIGDTAHAGTNSDHNHGTPQPGDRDVDAVDITPMPTADMWFVIHQFEKHPSAQYWIYQDRIAFKSEGWLPRSYAYAGPNRSKHFDHVHFNWEESDAAHNNTTPYGIEEIMPSADEIAKAVWTYGLEDPVATAAARKTDPKAAPVMKAAGTYQRYADIIAGSTGAAVIAGVKRMFDELHAQLPAGGGMTDAQVATVLDRLGAQLPALVGDAVRSLHWTAHVD